MDEIKVYHGIFTNGSDIDEALTRALSPQKTATNGSGYLASSGAVFAATANEIIKLVFSNVTGTGMTGGYVQLPTPSGGDTYSMQITSEHEVIGVEYSNPAAVMTGFGYETGNNTFQYELGLVGTTNITILLGRVGGKYPNT